MKISSLVTFMAHGPLRWRLWLLLGVPFVLVLFVLDVLMSIAHHLYTMFHWEWRDDLMKVVNSFSEKHRLSLLSLGRKPAPGGVVWHYKDGEA